MLLRNRPIVESSPALLARGYAWLPDLWRRTGGPLVRTRLLGRHAVALRGPDAVRFFYDEDHVRRGPALPEPVLSTLFGHGAVHTLDGDAHRARKALFVSLLMDSEGIARLVQQFRTAWDEAAASWGKRPSIVLFDEAAEVLTRAVCRWAGVPADDAGPLSRDLVAMVDGFATAGPRHWRARAARRRREEWLAGLIEDVRNGALGVPPDSAAAAVARHRDADGRTLDPRVAAVEVLNVIRPATAVAWFAAFAAHALHLWPEHRARLAAGDPAYAEAFAQEVRRFYPFAPFVGGQAVRDLTWRGEPIPAGATVLLDLYGQDHDGSLWPRPYTFDPGRFLGREVDPDLLVPQGGGDPRTGHRCPGELITVALLKEFATGLSRLRYEVPEQDLSISLRRVPARPHSGFVMAEVG
ncbi:cytochrome P450 [Actinomadura sp. 21ATH]|uniref:cytochrome P450 n=1 Tax=Actinomadura sp. 21ATH TaxID=1735444 RepID=UPI0035C24823